MQKPKFIFFDFNHVLAEPCIDRDALTAELLNIGTEEYKRFALQTSSKPEMRKLWQNMRTLEDEKEYFTAFSKELCALTHSTLSEQLQTDILNSRTVLSFCLRPGVKELLWKLQGVFGLGIITNARPSRRTIEIERLGLHQFIPQEHILISTEQGHSKPDREIYQKAIDVAGVDPGEIVYCDDKINFLESASKAGIGHLVLFSSTRSSKFFTVMKSALELTNYPPIAEVLCGIGQS